MKQLFVKTTKFLGLIFLIFFFTVYLSRSHFIQAAPKRPRPTPTPNLTAPPPPTPIPTATPFPTATPTPIPTATPFPTATPTPTPTPLAWKYTAMGDSLAKGLFAFIGYVPRYKSYIVTDTGITTNLSNLAVSGWTSAQLLNALETNATFQNSVTSSQVVTWDVGGADFLNARTSYKSKTCGGVDNQDCIRTAVASFKENWSNIIIKILSFRALNNTIIRTMDVYNPYVNKDKVADTWPNDLGNDFQVFKPYADEFNGYISSTATVNGIPYAKVYEAFNGPGGDEDPSDKGYISFDGLHPNDRGHKVIADLFRALGYSPLR